MHNINCRPTLIPVISISELDFLTFSPRDDPEIAKGSTGSKSYKEIWTVTVTYCLNSPQRTPFDIQHYLNYLYLIVM